MRRRTATGSKQAKFFVKFNKVYIFKKLLDLKLKPWYHKQQTAKLAVENGL